MKINTLQSCMEGLKRSLGTALVNSSIISFSDGQSLISYNSKPRNDALISHVTARAQAIVEKGGLGNTKYLMVDLPDDLVMITVVAGNYCWSSTIDKSQTTIGMLLNVILPDCTEQFVAAF